MNINPLQVKIDKKVMINIKTILSNHQKNLIHYINIIKQKIYKNYYISQIKQVKNNN